MSRRDEIRILNDQLKVLGDKEHRVWADAKEKQDAIGVERQKRLREITKANTDLVGAASKRFKENIDGVIRSYADKIKSLERERDERILEVQQGRKKVYDEAERAMEDSRAKMLAECDAMQKAVDAVLAEAMAPILVKRKELKLKLAKLENRAADATPVDVPSQPAAKVMPPPEDEIPDVAIPPEAPKGT
jgi:hypothetical protein